MFKSKVTEISKDLDENLAKHFKLAQEKGSGSWLTALPIQSMGYVLNKEEFIDSVKLRYGWQVTNLPAYCVCGIKNNVDHTLTCKHGGHTIFRHDRIKHTNAEFMKQVCHDVQIEPELIPIENIDYISPWGEQSSVFFSALFFVPAVHSGRPGRCLVDRA